MLSDLKQEQRNKLATVRKTNIFDLVLWFSEIINKKLLDLLY